jgi:hypothetical protein
VYLNSKKNFNTNLSPKSVMLLAEGFNLGNKNNEKQ